MKSIDVAVRFESGAFMTQRVNGRRASSTSSPALAASALGAKLFGAAFRAAWRLTAAQRPFGEETWRIEAMD